MFGPGFFGSIFGGFLAFVAGSAIFNQPDYKAVIDAMRAELATV